MNSIRFAMIEDEAPARAMLKHLMADLSPQSTCIGEAPDGDEGMALLGRCAPDLLFLDIEFPPDGAFGMLDRARRAGLVIPPIAFVTAYDSYALDAFRWAACHYLLKPVEPDQLRECLGRIPASPDLPLLLETHAATRSHTLPDRFTVKIRDRVKVLRWRDVHSIQTDHRLLFVHTAEGRFILDRTLEELVERLEPGFVRIHRSILVNLAYVQELDPSPGHTSLLLLTSGERLPVSRDRLAHVRQTLAQLFRRIEF